MDDRTWYLAITTLVVATAAILVDAPLVEFRVPTGFWTVLAAVLGFLGARAALGKNGNGKK